MRGPNEVPAGVTSATTVGVLLALSCSVTWGIANVYVQRAARTLGDLRAMLWAQLLGSAVLLPLGVLLGGAPARIDLPALAFTAVASGFGYYGMMRAFRQGPLGAITPVITGWPVFAAIAGVVWLEEAPSARQLLGAALIVVGASGNGALSRGGAWTGSKVDAFGWAVASAVGFGLMTAGVARLRPDIGDLTVVPLVWGAQWVALLPFVVRSPGILTPPDRWGAVAGMALFEAAGFVAFSLATRFAPVAVVSPPASLSTLLTAAFAALVLREHIGAARWGLIAVVVAGTVLIAG